MISLIITLAFLVLSNQSGIDGIIVTKLYLRTTVCDDSRWLNTMVFYTGTCWKLDNLLGVYVDENSLIYYYQPSYGIASCSDANPTVNYSLIGETDFLLGKKSICVNIDETLTVKFTFKPANWSFYQTVSSLDDYNPNYETNFQFIPKTQCNMKDNTMMYFLYNNLTCSGNNSICSAIGVTSFTVKCLSYSSEYASKSDTIQASKTNENLPYYLLCVILFLLTI